MTYCVGMALNKGLVMMSDTRTNSGVDNISVFRKMFHWSVPGERIITIMTAGNLATTQAVIAQLEERGKAPEERKISLFELPSMFQVASEIGRLLQSTVRRTQEQNGAAGAGRFTASIILSGQIKGMPPRLFMIYPEGNFIEATPDTPFFQIGETKYGRPILLRAYDPDMSFEDAIKLLIVSFDSTVKANLSVGLPLDMMIIEKDNFEPLRTERIEHGDAYFERISSQWGDELRKAFQSLPPFEFD